MDVKKIIDFVKSEKGKEKIIKAMQMVDKDNEVKRKLQLVNWTKLNEPTI